MPRPRVEESVRIVRIERIHTAESYGDMRTDLANVDQQRMIQRDATW